jgi:aquaporin Z
MEAGELGLFMLSALLFTVLLEHPASRLHAAIPQPILRRLLMGAAMGGTAIALIYSPWGKRSGAHFNPSVTLTFFRLGKIEPSDALFYVAFQFVGGSAGVFLAKTILGMVVSDPSVRYAATLPGPRGAGPAFVAETVISFVLMLVVLFVSSRKSVARLTGLCAGLLVLTYITFEAPLSGMSMNPARTLASALPGRLFTDLWIYFLAPPLGMLAAAQTFVALRGARAIACAKLHHQNSARCIFRCGY